MAFLGNRPSARVIAGLVVGVIAVVVLVGWSPLEPGVTTLLAVAAGLGAPASARGGRQLCPRQDARCRAAGARHGDGDGRCPRRAAGRDPEPGLPARRVSTARGLARRGRHAIDHLFLTSQSSSASCGATATAASTVTFIVPAFALVWGSFALAEPVGLGLIAGFMLILVSLCLVLGIAPTIRRPNVTRFTKRRSAVAPGTVPA